MALADLVVVMRAGRIEQADAPRALFERPRSAFVARFIGGHNVVPVALDGGAGVLADGTRIPLPALPNGADRLQLAIRADRIAVNRLLPGSVAVAATVRGVEYLGASVQLALALPGTDEFSAVLDERVFFAAPIAPGDRVAMSWAIEDVQILDA